MTAADPPNRPAAAGQNPDLGVYVISIAAELAGLHPQTLRSYERHGLIDPDRTAGGDRRYSENDLARVARINELTGDGVNVAGVQRILELEDEVRDLRAALADADRRVASAVEDAHRHHRRALVPTRQALVPWRHQFDFSVPYGGV